MIIETEIGKVQVLEAGLSEYGCQVYAALSVPYARAGRFEKPQLIERYPEGEIINRKETVCFPQHGYPLWMNRFMKHHMMRPEFLPMKDIQTEDAFVVNIWTDDFWGKKPVIVFVHGGGEGSGTVPIYTGAHLAEHGVVAVTITYRIGSFGYSPYFENGEMTANLAYYDQQAALIWIRNNIECFGGDPKNITLMGHCGGGLASLYQFLNPVSSKQFDKLILCAGNLPHMTPREKAEEKFRETLRKQKLTSASELKKIPAKKLIGRNNPIAQGDIIDGDFFVDDPEKLLAEGRYPSMPVLLGTNSDEFSMIEIPMYYKFLKITTKEKELDTVLREKYGVYAKKLKAAFEKDASGPVDIQTKIMELLVFHNSTYQMMKKFSEICPVYGYRLHYVPELYGGLRGSYHGAELALFFDNMDRMNIPVPEKNKKQTRILQTDWLAFVKTGEIPGRERFDETARITDYDEQITSIPFPFEELIEEVNAAGLCRKAREGYLETM